MSGNGGPLLGFFGRKWLTLPSPPHDGIHLQMPSSIKSKATTRDGLCGREPGWLGSLWRAAVTARSEGPLPRALPVKAISATPLLLLPQVQGSLCGRSPSRAITCVQRMFLIHIKVKAASKSASSQLWQDSWPSLYFIFFFPFSFFLLLLSPAECN